MKKDNSEKGVFKKIKNKKERKKKDNNGFI